MRATSSARRGVTEQGSATTNVAGPPAPAARPPDAGECLSPLDASFLYLERPTELLHVGAVAVLEAPPAFEALIDALGERLGALQRYRQVPVRPTFDLGPPRWRDDTAFDPRRHVHRATVPAPGDDAAFQRVLDELFARPFAGDHPLWECHLLEGLTGGRAALLVKVHHCMIDGVSGVQVLEAMTDGAEANGGSAAGSAPAGATASPLARLVPIPHLVPAFARDLFGGLGTMLRVATNPGRALANLQATVAAAGVVADLARRRLRPFSFNGTLGHTRRIVWASFELDEFLAMRGAAGCKVNDVALAVIAGALRRFLPVEATSSGRRARALIPMNVRRDDEHLTLGNRVSGMFVSLPLDVADARERLHLIAAEMRAHKEGGQARAFDLAIAVAGAVPTALAPLVARLSATDGRWRIPSAPTSPDRASRVSCSGSGCVDAPPGRSAGGRDRPRLRDPELRRNHLDHGDCRRDAGAGYRPPSRRARGGSRRARLSARRPRAFGAPQRPAVPATRPSAIS